jgi:uncharacterized protein YecE (DUF72 family)
MIYRIGCSGYYYPQWKNKLYPKGVAPKNWLAYYSTIFNTVELNGTFYRQPKIGDLQKYASVTNADFTFSVKMSRYITHVQRFKEKQTIVEFQDRVLQGLGQKLQYFLFQTPANFQYSKENLESLIDGIPHSPQNVIEFRHLSWWNDEVKSSLRSASITFCNVDFPKLESWFIHTTPFFYLRLHGSPGLFLTRYTKLRLEQFHKMFPADARICNVYFNNTMTEAGFENALELKEIAVGTTQIGATSL